MRYTYFEIRNFKGIEKARLDLKATPQARVQTLIGLNESGKTTVLEAINRLAYRENLEALNAPGFGLGDPHDWIPIGKRFNFNDKVVIEAGVELNDADQLTIASAVKREHGITLTAAIPPFTIKQTYEFKASKVVDPKGRVNWTLALKGKVVGQKRATALYGDAWEKVTTVIRDRLPRIVYFPNFLFDFPDRIYLENPPSNATVHTFYRAVLQDVLDATGQGTNVNEHILARAKSSASSDKKSLESVLLGMGGHITKEVFTGWDKIFKKPKHKKEIVVTIEADERGAWYLQLRLKQDNEQYDISERSLGFRWFFTYLLLTRYRGFRKGSGNVVFLLDEPASNLHPSAQAQLLESFGHLPDGSQVIYTTHSHHMIKPEWLEGASVVRNEGLDYGKDEEEYSARRTVVTLHRYRQFVAQHPNQVTYFQPVLDVLDYAPGRLENVPDVVMAEGKGDFYIAKFIEQVEGAKERLNLLPGGGAGSLGDVIRLYVAWGRNFIVLLDSDTEGEKQKQRYRDEFGALVNRRIVTLGDLDETWSGKGIEKLFEEPELLAIQQSSYPDAAVFNKTHFGRAVQEIVLTRKVAAIGDETRGRLTKLLAGLRGRLAEVGSELK